MKVTENRDQGIGLNGSVKTRVVAVLIRIDYTYIYASPLRFTGGAPIHMPSSAKLPRAGDRQINPDVLPY